MAPQPWCTSCRKAALLFNQVRFAGDSSNSMSKKFAAPRVSGGAVFSKISTLSVSPAMAQAVQSSREGRLRIKVGGAFVTRTLPDFGAARLFVGVGNQAMVDGCHLPVGFHFANGRAALLETAAPPGLTSDYFVAVALALRQLCIDSRSNSQSTPRLDMVAWPKVSKLNSAQKIHQENRAEIASRRQRSVVTPASSFEDAQLNPWAMPGRLIGLRQVKEVRSPGNDSARHLRQVENVRDSGSALSATVTSDPGYTEFQVLQITGALVVARVTPQCNGTNVAAMVVELLTIAAKQSDDAPRGPVYTSLLGAPFAVISAMGPAASTTGTPPGDHKKIVHFVVWPLDGARCDAVCTAVMRQANALTIGQRFVRQLTDGATFAGPVSMEPGAIECVAHTICSGYFEAPDAGVVFVPYNGFSLQVGRTNYVWPNTWSCSAGESQHLAGMDIMTRFTDCAANERRPTATGNVVAQPLGVSSTDRALVRHRFGGPVRQRGAAPADDPPSDVVRRGWIRTQQRHRKRQLAQAFLRRLADNHPALVALAALTTARHDEWGGVGGPAVVRRISFAIGNARLAANSRFATSGSLPMSSAQFARQLDDANGLVSRLREDYSSQASTLTATSTEKAYQLQRDPDGKDVLKPRHHILALPATSEHAVAAAVANEDVVVVANDDDAAAAAAAAAVANDDVVVVANDDDAAAAAAAVANDSAERKRFVPRDTLATGALGNRLRTRITLDFVPGLHVSDHQENAEHWARTALVSVDPADHPVQIVKGDDEQLEEGERDLISSQLITFAAPTLQMVLIRVYQVVSESHSGCPNAPPVTLKVRGYAARALVSAAIHQLDPKYTDARWFESITIEVYNLPDACWEKWAHLYQGPQLIELVGKKPTPTVTPWSKAAPLSAMSIPAETPMQSPTVSEVALAVSIEARGGAGATVMVRLRRADSASSFQSKIRANAVAVTVGVDHNGAGLHLSLDVDTPDAVVSDIQHRRLVMRDADQFAGYKHADWAVCAIRLDLQSDGSGRHVLVPPPPPPLADQQSDDQAVPMEVDGDQRNSGDDGQEHGDDDPAQPVQFAQWRVFVQPGASAELMHYAAQFAVTIADARAIALIPLKNRVQFLIEAGPAYAPTRSADGPLERNPVRQLRPEWSPVCFELPLGRKKTTSGKRTGQYARGAAVAKLPCTFAESNPDWTKSFVSPEAQAAAGRGAAVEIDKAVVGDPGATTIIHLPMEVVNRALEAKNASLGQSGVAGGAAAVNSAADAKSEAMDTADESEENVPRNKKKCRRHR